MKPTYESLEDLVADAFEESDGDRDTFMATAAPLVLASWESLGGKIVDRALGAMYGTQLSHRRRAAMETLDIPGTLDKVEAGGLIPPAPGSPMHFSGGPIEVLYQMGMRVQIARGVYLSHATRVQIGDWMNRQQRQMERMSENIRLGRAFTARLADDHVTMHDLFQAEHQKAA